MLNKNQWKMIISLPEYPQKRWLARPQLDEWAAVFDLTMADLRDLKEQKIIDYGYGGPGEDGFEYFIQKGINAAEADREYREHLADRARLTRSDFLAIAALIISVASLVVAVLNSIS